MNSWIESTNALSAAWAPWLWRACWQGAIAIAVAWLITLALRKISPRLRSWIWRLAYLKLLLLLVWTSPISLRLLPAAQESGIRSQESSVSASDANSSFSREANRNAFSNQPAALGNASSAGSATASGDHGGQAAQPSAIAAQVQPTNQSHLGLTTALFMAWLAGVVVVVTLFVFDAWRAWRFVRSARSLDEPRWLAACQEVCHRMAVRRIVRLCTSDSARGPLLVRFVSPAIVIPERFVDQLTCEEARLVLARELAHLRRHDLGWNSLSAVAACSAVFPSAGVAGPSFFSPGTRNGVRRVGHFAFGCGATSVWTDAGEDRAANWRPTSLPISGSWYFDFLSISCLQIVGHETDSLCHARTGSVDGRHARVIRDCRRSSLEISGPGGRASARPCGHKIRCFIGCQTQC